MRSNRFSLGCDRKNNDEFGRTAIKLIDRKDKAGPPARLFVTSNGVEISDPNLPAKRC